MNGKKKRPTLQDIADQIGITKMTVSRYLRNPDQVSEAIGKQIAKTVEELGYIPNRAPDLLSKAKSHAIGVLVPSLTNQVFAEVIRGIEQVTEPAGYQTMLAHYSYSQTAEENRIAALLSYNVDGIILSESYHTERAKRMLQTTGIPVVEIMDSVSPALQQAVGFDNALASRVMTETLIRKGKRQIIYFAARMDIRTNLKIAGYQEAMRAAGLTPAVVHTEAASSFSVGVELLHRALASYPDMDGIFCTNDDLAIGAIFECQRLGIPVPERIAIAGFHGHDIASVVSPRLATVVTPRKTMGRIAAEQLLGRINATENTPTPAPVIDLEFEIEEGESI